MANAQMTITVDERLRDALKEHAKISGRKLGNIIEGAITQHMGKAYEQAEANISNIGKAFKGDQATLEVFKKEMEKIMRETLPFKALYDDLESEAYGEVK